MQPEVPIEVDPDSGHWSTYGLPMIYVPRHFFMGVVDTVQKAIGEEAAARQFYAAGYDAAYAWCAAEARAHGLAGMDVFHHYMDQLSRRGWGRFDGTGIDPETGTGVVRLYHSSFVAHFGTDSGRKVCQFCAGWPPGGLAWVSDSLGRHWQPVGEEVCCAAEGFDHCELRVWDARNDGTATGRASER